MEKYIRHHDMDAGEAKREAFRAAYANMSEDERTLIDAHAQALIDVLKGRNGKIKISLESGRELIFSAWIWIDKFERGVK